MKVGKWYISLFNLRKKEYGGHGHWLARLFFYRLDYLSFNIIPFTRYKYIHLYYDGQHHAIKFLCFEIGWGGAPYYNYK